MIRERDDGGGVPWYVDGRDGAVQYLVEGGKQEVPLEATLCDLSDADDARNEGFLWKNAKEGAIRGSWRRPSARRW
jgi:hypothetical protein